MRSVPWRWKRNNTNSTSTLSGTTILPNTGVATRSPSTAPSTVIAGVMTPSPYRSAAPNNPSVMSTDTGTMPTRPRRPRWMQRQQRENAALAAIVGAHDERQILDAHD